MPIPLTHDDPVVLGPYRLIARLGSGGMGTVYAARTAGGRTVALKTMQAAIATDPAARTRFRLEVDAARVIGDRFGARVMDADPLAETPWLATEYVLGPALDEAVEAVGPLPERSVRALGAALCSALGQLHRSDVVHRDLKPSNILVTAYGPKVIDFGIARAIGDVRLTRTGAAVGTPAFMSPEQATGRDHDAAGDVFALAGVLVYAAAGRSPFGRGQAADLLYRVRYGEADLSGVPTPLVPLLARCLAKEPGERPSTQELAGELHDGNGEFADHLPDALLADIGRRAAEVWRPVPQRLPAPAAETGPEAVAAQRDTGPSRRWFLAGSGALALSAAGGGVWWWRGRADRDDGTDTGNGPEQTRNLDPMWEFAGSPLMMDNWGLAVPYPVDGAIVLPLHAIKKYVNPSTGREKRQVPSSVDWWQTAVVDDQIYQLSDDYSGNGHPVVVAVYDEGQDYVKPTPARLADTNFELQPNQLLCVTGNVAYVAVGSGTYSASGFLASQLWTIRAVDIKTGKALWSRPLPKRPDKSERLHFLASKVVGSRLVTLQEVEDKTVRVVVRDTRSGAVLWDKPYDVDAPEPLRSEIAADDHHLYLGGPKLRKLRLSDGAQVWATGAGRRYGPPTLKSGVVYAVGEGAGFTALDADGGKVLWAEKAGEADDPYTGWRPIIGTRYAYYRNGLQLRVLSLSTHGIALTYRTSGEQFYEDAKARLVLAVDADHLSAYPLK